MVVTVESMLLLFTQGRPYANWCKLMQMTPCWTRLSVPRGTIENRHTHKKRNKQRNKQRNKRAREREREKEKKKQKKKITPGSILAPKLFPFTVEICKLRFTGARLFHWTGRKNEHRMISFFLSFDRLESINHFPTVTPPSPPLPALSLSLSLFLFLLSIELKWH